MELFNSYIAGFFDGEGCITSQLTYITGKYEKYPRISVQITISNTDKDILDEIQKVYGGTVHKKFMKVKDCYHLRITGKWNMKRFLEAILPYSRIKREQIEIALKFIETLRTENLGCCSLDSTIHQYRKIIHNKLKELKTIAPIDGDINEQIPEIAGKSLWDNPQPSLYEKWVTKARLSKIEEGSETIMGTSQGDDGIVRTVEQSTEIDRNVQSTSEGKE